MLNGLTGGPATSQPAQLDIDGSAMPTESAARLDAYWLARLLCLAVIAASVLVLAGRWLTESQLTTLFGSGQSGSANSSVAFAALALGLLLTLPSSAGPARRRVLLGRGLALASLLTAIVTLLWHAFGSNFAVDDLFGILGGGFSSGGPPSVQAAFGVAVVGLAVISGDRRVGSAHVAEVLALVGGSIGVLAFLGYLYGATALISFGGSSVISLAATIRLLAISSAIVASNKDHTLVRLFDDPGTTGQVIRRFVPAALLVAPVGAWIKLLGDQLDLYDQAVGLTLTVAFEALLLVVVGAWTASRAGQLDESRRRAHADLVRLGVIEATPLIETSPIGLALLDRDLRCLYVNPSLAAATGRSVADSLGRRIDRLMPALAGEPRFALDEALRNGREVQELEVGGPGADGRQGTWLVNARPLHAGREENAGLAVSVMDISERKRREEALASIAEMRRQTMAVDESIPYGVWIAGPDGRMRYLSRSFLALIGRSMREAADFGWADSLAPESASGARRAVLDAISGERPWNFELDVIGADGNRRTILSRGLPIRDEDGVVTSWAGINLDISDRKQRDAFRDAFVGIVSHELRTPITSIYAASSLLGRAGLDDGQKAELLADIAAESERLRRLTEDLVVLAKAEHGTIQVRNEPVLLQHLLRRIIDQEKARWPDRDFTLTMNAALPVASGDSDFVEQIVRNLLGNAAKYGGPGTEVEIVADAPDGCPRIRVLDRGPGIDPAEADRLFEVFYRSYRTSRVSGSGIGLFVAHELVQAIGGTIWARPRDDGPGSEFGIILQPLPVDPI
jgi:PAS domain S-box-containing protein